MSAPLIWVVIPIVAGAILFVFRRWERWVHFIGLAVALILAYLAYSLPVGVPIPIRIWSGVPAFVLDDSMALLSARLVIQDAARPVYLIIYLSISAWFAAFLVVRKGGLFVPFALAIAGILSAALAITPSNFAPFLVEVAVILGLPLLSPPGVPVRPGVYRYLIFQTLGMGTILLANWSYLLDTVQAGQSADPLLTFVLFGLGFALLLPVFPFHSWVPMVLSEANRLESTCMFYLLIFTNSILMAASLTRMGLSGSLDQAILLLQGIGVLMVFLGGVSSAIENRPGRVIGFALHQQTGLVLLALSLTLVPGPSASFRALFFAQFVPFSLGLLLCALSLEIIGRETPAPDLASIFNAAHRLPLASAGFLLGLFSLAGLPSLATFPVLLDILAPLEARSPLGAVLCVLGLLLLAVFAVRVLTVVKRSSPENAWSSEESRAQVLVLSAGMLLLLLLGLFSGFYPPYFAGISAGLSGSLP